MAKFNLTKGIGSNLLNDVSKANKQAEDFKVIPLDINLLDPNEDNEGMSLDDIEELAQSILDNGLDQNFVVVPKRNGRYKILTGHRRRLACLKLIAEGHEEWKYVPCLIKDITKITLNLSDTAKERYALLTTNLERRKNTLRDEMKMLDLANSIFDELVANGEDVGQRRKWVAERLGVSDSKVKILDYIQGHAEPEIKKEIDKNRITPTVANEIAHLNKEEQRALHAEKNNELPEMKAEDINKWKKEREIKKHEEIAKKESKHVLTSAVYSEAKNSIEQQIPLLEHGIEVTDEEYQRLIKMQETVKKTLFKMNNLILKAEARKNKR